MSLKVLLIASVGVLSSSAFAAVCQEGTCASPAKSSLPRDETSLLQVKSVVTHGPIANGIATAHTAGVAAEVGPSPWLMAAIRFLDQHLGSEGLWRKMGLKETAEKLVEDWKSGQFTMDDNPANVVQAVGRLLKEDPLLSDYLSLTLSSLDKRTTNVLCQMNMRFTMQKVPMTPQKFADLKLLLDHWKQVNKNEAINLMNMDTLTTCTFVLLIPETQPVMMKVYPMFNKKSQFQPNLGIMIANPDKVLYDPDENDPTQLALCDCAPPDQCVDGSF